MTIELSALRSGVQRPSRRRCLQALGQGVGAVLGAVVGRVVGPVGALTLGSAPGWAGAAPSDSVMFDELTSFELRERLALGSTTALVPIGGTEQNGPHLVLGKHNVRVRVLATRIALRLGRTLVLPVVSQVPEGTIDPPTQHMRYAGTLSIPDAAFEAVLEGLARSLRQHGFRDVVLLGDHGGYQKSLQRVADRLNPLFAKPLAAGLPVCRVHALNEYYQITQTAYVEALKARGHTDEEIGRHAGLADTSLALAVDTALVRMDIAAARPRGAADGVSGDPRRASAELGRLGTDKIVEVSVAAISARLARR